MARRRYLVAYDIREPNRLRRVHQTMKGFGYPMQYSVFICDLDGREKVFLKRDVGDVIDHRVDSVAILDLGEADRRGSECFEFMGARIALPWSGPTIV
ncbi:MAG: CRISPR-associated endonuclease Cas2 [Acidimicrobiia bacterium]